MTIQKHKFYLLKLAQKMGYAPYLKKVQAAHTHVDGLRIHLDVMHASYDAPTIVIIPGTATYALCYVDLMIALYEKGFNIVGVDPRGHGRSEGERGNYTLLEIIKDAQAAVTYAIENFNDQVSVLGSSQGGIAAFYMAAMDDRIGSVICQNFADLSDLNSTLELSLTPLLSKTKALVKPILNGANSIMPRLKVPISTYADFSKMKVKHFGTAKDFMDQDPFALKTVRLRAIKSLASTKLPIDIETIQTPIFVLQGAEDEIFPVEYTYNIYYQLTCKKRIEIYENLGHTILVENTDVIMPNLLEWLHEIHGAFQSEKIDHKRA